MAKAEEINKAFLNPTSFVISDDGSEDTEDLGSPKHWLGSSQKPIVDRWNEITKR
jgi:hypothetical protein